MGNKSTKKNASDDVLMNRELTLADSGVYGPFVGDVSCVCAWAIMRVPPSHSVTHNIKQIDGSDGGSVVVKWHVEPVVENDFVGRLVIRHLKADRQYELSSTVDGNDVHKCTFRTLPNSSKNAMKFAFSSCIGGQGFGRPVDEGWCIFDAMRARQPDLWLLIGDSIYADDKVDVDGGEFAKVPMEPGAEEVCRNEDQLYARYRYHLRDAHYMRLLQSTNTFCIWDDHEVCDDWGMRKERILHPQYVKHASKSFATYWPIAFGAKDKEVPEIPGRLYRNVAYGDLCEFFILDCRSYRSVHAIALEETLDEAPKAHRARSVSRGQPKMSSMLGNKQTKWLMKKLKQSKAIWKFIVSSVPVAWDTGSRPDPMKQGKDGWSDRGARAELGRILAHIHKHNVTNVVFITADVHFPSATRYACKLDRKSLAVVAPNNEPDFDDVVSGPTFHEFGAGPLAALVLSPGKQPNQTFRPDVLYSAGDFNADLHNFGMVSVARDKVTFEVVNKRGETQCNIEVPSNT